MRTTRTASDYRFFALPGGALPRPGLIRAEPGRGAGIEVEVRELDEAAFGSLMSDVPPLLAIGTLVLDGGSAVKGFLCEPLAVEGARDVGRLASGGLPGVVDR